MKCLLIAFCMLFAICSTTIGSLAADKVVVIPLWKTKKNVGNAVPADVLQGKTFTSVDGEHTGVRPPAPVGADYINSEGVNPPVPRFTLYNYNGAEQTGYGVKDLMTGLIWMKSPSSSTDTWGNAAQSCEDMFTTYMVLNNAYVFVRDWRLPTVKEMNSLLDYGRGLVHVAGDNAVAGLDHFSNVQSGEYWTSSMLPVPCPGGGQCFIAYAVDIDQATIRKQIFTGGEGDPVFYSWCVRGPYTIVY